GCGSLSVEPGTAERLEARYGRSLAARQVAIGEAEDEHEALFERGWTDGLPVIPPTPERVVRMLAATSRPSDEVIAEIPPNLAPCTVEKVAINAVMAGCKPEYFPVVLAAVEAACQVSFGLHGLLATTLSHGPVVIVGGPIARRIGMNSGINALGQGNRANATIGRALQLVVRNVGGGRPGEVDRACLGSPAKYTFCFAENEADSPWESLAVERGFSAEASTVTLFGGEAPRVIIDQLSRQPESLAGSFAACLRTVCHPKLPMVFDVVLVVSPEHARVFQQAGWSKDRLRRELLDRLMLPRAELERGAGGIAEGVPEAMLQPVMPKFRPEGLLIVHAGGPAGLFSALIGGWVNGEMGTNPVTVEVRT
ncbi:MAG: thioredoxin, partial [Acidobacteriota bacterium]